MKDRTRIMFSAKQRILTSSTLTLLLFGVMTCSASGQEESHPFLVQIQEQASALKTAFGDQVGTTTKEQYAELAISFLSAADSLQPVQSRDVFRKKSPNSWLSPRTYEQLSNIEQEPYSKLTCDEKLYYGNYSTPLAWTRPFDRLGPHGFDSFDGKRVLDFGFGNVGQLRMMASLGADVTGVEIANSVSSAMYHLDSDQGEVRRHSDSIKNTGKLSLVFGKWPAEQETRNSVGQGYDLFISKNVLKYGYIHPERDAPASQLIDLGVSDEEFLSTLFQSLKPGGLVLVYNIHPPKSKDNERYKPWAYGETPWNRNLVTQAGFEILEWHVDDSIAIHDFGRLIEWDKSYATEAEFQANFRAMYTILKKPMK